ncbi:MAG: hypothetical protein WC390_09020 [Sulfurimonas sp.]|jgi:hypothetical protein
MRFHYDLTGAEPIVRDVPVYDAASMANGELIMLGTTDPDSAVDMNVSFVTAYVSGSNTEAVDALGIVNEDFSTAASIDNTPVEGSKFLKAIINPFAIYLCEYSQGTSDDVAITTGGVSTSVTITSIEDDIDAGWIYFPLAVGGAAGKLRLITAATTNTLTVDSAITTTTSDTIIKILPLFHATTNLTTDAKKLHSQAAIGEGVSLRVVENYIEADGIPFKALRYADKGKNGLTGVRIYADLVMLDHIYNPA